MKKYLVNERELFSKNEAWDAVYKMVAEGKNIVVKEVECEEFILIDYSWALDEKLNNTYIMLKEDINITQDLKCIILESDLKIPSENYCNSIHYVDTKIKSIKTGNIYYTQKGFLRNKKFNKSYINSMGFSFIPNRMIPSNFPSI